MIQFRWTYVLHLPAHVMGHSYRVTTPGQWSTTHPQLRDEGVVRVGDVVTTGMTLLCATMGYRQASLVYQQSPYPATICRVHQRTEEQSVVWTIELGHDRPVTHGQKVQIGCQKMTLFVDDEHHLLPQNSPVDMMISASSVLRRGTGSDMKQWNACAMPVPLRMISAFLTDLPDEQAYWDRLLLATTNPLMSTTVPLSARVPVLLLPQESVSELRTYEDGDGPRVSFMGWINMLSHAPPELVQRLLCSSPTTDRHPGLRHVWQHYQEMFALLYRVDVDIVSKSATN
jgi:hypothetical protein